MKFHTCNDLKKEIHSKLDGLIGKKCVLLNTPDHINIGDQLIWQGEMDYLTEKGISPFYITSNFNFDWRDLTEDTQILMHGGGNFGDVWEYHHDFRLKIIEKYPNNPIFIFPQSVQYHDPEKIKKDAEVYSAHQNLTICARDAFSFDLLKENFGNRILLVPDMAFCSNYTKIEGKTGKTLLLKRTDREIASKIEYGKYPDFDLRDWPTYDNTLKNFLWRVYEKLNRMFASGFVKNKNGNTTFGLGVLRNKDYLVKMGVKFISEYDLVVTTRLHGHILALLLGIDSIMIDNNYGKNSRFHQTWLHNFPNSKMVANETELNVAIAEFQKSKKG